jgi:four helix bundle protein
MAFDHERLDVYRRALELVVVAHEVAANLPKGRGYLTDQLRRAATSIPLNIAEGAGEFAPQDKARFYRIARRSATETAAILDVCRNLELLAEDQHRGARELLIRIVSMLTRLAQRGDESASLRARAGARAGAREGESGNSAAAPPRTELPDTP